MKPLSLALLLLFAPLAGAQQCTQLTYVGAPFSSVVATASNGAANNGQPVYSPLTGMVTLSTPLPANASNLTVTPASWSFTEPAAYTPFLVSGGWMTQPFNHATFIFSTDANGNITAWSIGIYYNGGSGPAYTSTVASSQAGDTVEVQMNTEGPLGQVVTTGSSSSAGTWTCPAGMSSAYTAPADPPAVDPLAAQVASLTSQLAASQAEVTYLKAWEANDNWQAVGWKARAAVDAQLLANAQREIAILKAQLAAK
jgi:hypothetical protein